MDKKINISLDDISIWLFHKIATTSDTSLLEVENHSKVWEYLIQQYQDCIGKDVAYLWLLKLQIEQLKNKVMRCHTALKIVYLGYPKDGLRENFIDLLKKDKIIVNEISKNEYQKHLNYLKAIEVKIKLKSKELENVSSGQQVEWNLTQELFTLSRILDLKYKLSAKDTTVGEYIVIVNEAKKTVHNGK